jgi:hypothetical protein
LEENLDEDARAGGGVVFSESDIRQARPVVGLCVEQVAEEFGAIPELVDFEFVHILVLLGEHLVEQGRVQVRVDQAEALRKQTEETQVGALLRAALIDHVA